MRLLLLLCFVTLTSLGQNLAQNGGFEVVKRNFKYDHNIDSGVKMLKHWYNPNRGTPDYIHRRSRRKEMRFEKYGKINSSFSGDACVGLTYPGPRYEYIQTELVYPLEAGKNYCISVHYATIYTNMKTSDFGVYLSMEKIKNHERFAPFYVDEKLDLIGASYDGSDGWVELCQKIKAVGGERYLTIGCFRRFPNEQDASSNSFCKCAPYSYIDDISLTIMSDTSGCECNSKQSEMGSQDNSFKDTLVEPFGLEKDKNLILKDLYFETAKWEILETSFASLDKLTTYLKDHSEIKVEISGHTDNVGSEKDNQSLSENRAKSVVDYLIAEGIEPERLSYKGYGSSQPLTDNTTAEGRAQNRRVEIRIVDN